MRWPWEKRPERRQAANYTEALINYLVQAAAGTEADAGSTAAIESAAGSLSRSFAAAEVQGPEWVRRAATRRFMGQVGRSLIREGQSLHAIRTDAMGDPVLIPCSTYYFYGQPDPATWRVIATAYGPDDSMTWTLPFNSVVYVQWGTTPARPYIGAGPLGWARTTARLAGEADRSLADEMAGPLAQILAIPGDGGSGGDADPLKMLKADLAAARGSATLVETTSAGWGEGKDGAPRRDWRAERLGPAPPDALVNLRKDAFSAMLAAAGVPPALFDPRSDGTSQRESLRRFHMGTVLPLAEILADELTAKLETDVALTFDTYALDLAGRAQSFAKLVQGGMSIERAAAVSGVLGVDDE